MAWACMASSGTWLLVFINDMTENRRSQKNSEVYRDILSAQIQQIAAKLTALHSTSGNDPKHTAKATQEFLKVKKWNILQWPSQFPEFQPDRACISLAENKTSLAENNPHKQTITEVSCGNQIFGDVHEFQT